jgi:uncharacterized membrane protein YkoI
MKRFFGPKALLAAAALAFALHGAASAQHTGDDCGPLQGTISVSDDAPDRAALARITEDQAREAALRAVAGTTVSEADLDEEDGYLVYEIDLVVGANEHEVYVDAGSGEVLCVDRED